jgi:hypothetical protein
MIGGPSFDGAKGGRYEANYDPDKDATRGHGLRLASDDLYDCQWDSRHAWKVPKTAKSGIYAAGFDFEKDSVAYQYPVTTIAGTVLSCDVIEVPITCKV